MKILSITADNVTSNDTMIDELAGLLTHFGEEAGQTCCFLHVINLVVKTLIRLFDLPRGKGKAGTQNMDDELRRLAEDIDFEDFQTRKIGRAHV